ncbi:MAG: peptidase M20 [Clostridia bacterium BRH_c25]|nr:MAG: peptidase M20 [Clostridia bacterium BRH_c25]
MAMISQLVKEYESYIVSLRRHFHMYPELSWSEFETSKRIKAELDEMGIPYRSLAGTGILATIEGKQPGKTVALRADIDALNVKEENQLEYNSKNEGFMHACGHDGHTAMLLGAAKVLNALKGEFSGTVKLFFQPAEEQAAGARKMIEEGALEEIDGIMGIHLWSGLPTGKISCEAGPRMASGDYVIVDIEGKGGHGSLPHQTVDTVLVTAAFLLNIQSIISREISPLDPAVITFGEVKTGTRFNVIPEKAHLEGTFRCFDPKIRAQLPKIIERYANYIAESYRASGKCTFHEGMPPTINDSGCSEIAKQSVLDFLGEEGLALFEKTTGSEDMAYYLEKVPGIIAFVGTQNPGKGSDFPHHHPKFNIDEDSLIIGTELYVRFALNFIK